MRCRFVALVGDGFVVGGCFLYEFGWSFRNVSFCSLFEPGWSFVFLGIFSARDFSNLETFYHSSISDW